MLSEDVFVLLAMIGMVCFALVAIAGIDALMARWVTAYDAWITRKLEEKRR